MRAGLLWLGSFFALPIAIENTLGQKVALAIGLPGFLLGFAAFVIVCSKYWKCPVCQQLLTKQHPGWQCEHCGIRFTR